MKILLLDNATDSFEWSLRHLRTFLEMDSKFIHKILLPFRKKAEKEPQTQPHCRV